MAKTAEKGSGEGSVLRRPLALRIHAGGDSRLSQEKGGGEGEKGQPR